MHKTLILFARKPELGKVKTRLAKSIGNKKALEIYTQLLEHTISISTKVESKVKIYWSKKLSYTTDNYQKGSDLGERMYNALKDEVGEGKVCLLGTDTPSITQLIIKDAFKALDECDIVFGPAKDGGYYLVAIKAAPIKELFLQKTWSHSNVLADALKACDKQNLRVHLLTTLQDIDTVYDYNDWQNAIKSF